MDVIGHQYIGMQSTTAVVCAFTQYVEIHQIVASTGEARNPIVSSLDDMERYRRQDKATRTWHGESETLRETRRYKTVVRRQRGKSTVQQYSDHFQADLSKYRALTPVL